MSSGATCVRSYVLVGLVRVRSTASIDLAAAGDGRAGLGYTRIGQEELIEEYPLAVGRETTESNRRPGDRSAPTGPPRRIGVGPVSTC